MLISLRSFFCCKFSVYECQLQAFLMFQAKFPINDRCWRVYKNTTKAEQLCDKSFGLLKVRMKIMSCQSDSYESDSKVVLPTRKQHHIHRWSMKSWKNSNSQDWTAKHEKFYFKISWPWKNQNFYNNNKKKKPFLTIALRVVASGRCHEVRPFHISGMFMW